MDCPSNCRLCDYGWGYDRCPQKWSSKEEMLSLSDVQIAEAISTSCLPEDVIAELEKLIQLKQLGYRNNRSYIWAPRQGGSTR